MKIDVSKYVACGCQQVKIDQNHIVGKLQPLDVPLWQCDDITVDFVVVVPHTPKENDAIWVIVDWARQPIYSILFVDNYSVLNL